MHNQGMKLFRIHGVDVTVHFSWWIIVVLLAYSLAVGYFPTLYPGAPSALYWVMGVIAAICLFLSVIFHELTHSFVARAFKVPVDHITLFFFGGVASLPTEHIQPKTEFWMALSGPLFSLTLSLLLYFVSQLSLPLVLSAIVTYLWHVNLALALFNLVPGYPLDGGRVFRALLMFGYHDVVKATRVASVGGKVFGGMLIFVGFLQFIGGVFSGLWLVLIGGFIWFVAKASYETVVVQELLGKVSVSRLVQKNVPVLKPTDKFQKFVGLYGSSDYSAFLVLSGRKIAGIVDIARAAKVPRALWENLLVSGVMVPAAEFKVLSPHENVYTALRRMDEAGLSMLPVVDNGKVLGMVARNRIIRQLAFDIG